MENTIIIIGVSLVVSATLTFILKNRLFTFFSSLQSFKLNIELAEFSTY